MAVVTPCYSPDKELCRELHQSVLDFTPSSTVHHLIVPDAEMASFASFRGPRSVIWSYGELLPPRFVPARWVNPVLQRLGGLAASVNVAAINTRRPWPPIRGWILQQALKLAAAPRVDADVVVVVDADVQFIRPVSVSTFIRDGRLMLYRVEGGVHPGLPDHVAWHRVARRLLGLPEHEPPYHDYVTSPIAWDPKAVGALQHRIETVTGRPWIDAVSAQRKFSECTLYGTFVDEVLGSPANQVTTDRSRCHNYWDEVPMSAEKASEFAKAAPHDDMAVMISAKSRTPMDIRRSAIAEIQASTSRR
ncbi:MAG TPA: DUF6492 family protein [Acidimicrobiales bacterium]|nr:DUF6492 family protein [Acidimicrobiales bacterium]HLN43839.1 DUF6492 family protein [Acidimicrobiales bacterium]